MFVGIGFSENPDSSEAGREVALTALQQASRKDSCNLILLFATARHDISILREAVIKIFGIEPEIVGGGAAGIITQEQFGYAGGQVGLAAFWLEETQYDLLVETDLSEGERQTGHRLGQRLADLGITPQSQLLLFYDAIAQTHGTPQLMMATYLLRGLQERLGFLPTIVGAGLQGDYLASPTRQLTGHGVAQHSVLALLFAGSLRIDHTIMHGCRPATGYYTVTKADAQTILEINKRPALLFVNDLLQSAIPPESYPFFLTFGVNLGEKWAEFDEDCYANRLCLAIDKERNGIIMFEPDMVEGTKFQIMYRSLDLDYMGPKIEQLFKKAERRKAIFALYINCAGRAAGFGGVSHEDAVKVQKTVAGRVPLFGIYTGVEIGSVRGHPRGLDWTGVFCLFSVPK